MKLFKKTITKFPGECKRVLKCTHCESISSLDKDVCWDCGHEHFVKIIARRVVEHEDKWWDFLLLVKPYKSYWEEMPKDNN